MMNVSDNIKAIRKEKGLTQTEVAKRYGTSPEFYHRLEKKDKTLTIDQLEKIADALGVTVIELLGHRKADQNNEVEGLHERIKELEKENERLNETLGFVRQMMDLVNRNPAQITQIENDLFDGDNDKKDKIKNKVMDTIKNSSKDTK